MEKTARVLSLRHPERKRSFLLLVVVVVFYVLTVTFFYPLSLPMHPPHLLLPLFSLLLLLALDLIPYCSCCSSWFFFIWLLAFYITSYYCCCYCCWCCYCSLQLLLCRVYFAFWILDFYKLEQYWRALYINFIVDFFTTYRILMSSFKF